MAVPLTQPQSRFISTQRLTLHYADWGNTSAPALLLLHGGRDHCRSWDWTARALCTDWHVIAPDLRGHGDSDWTSDGIYPIDAFVYDLARLIDTLDAPEVTIVGHSFGGNIAVRYTGLYPDRVRRLVCIEGLGRSPRTLAERAKVPLPDQIRQWISARLAAESRNRRAYATFAQALDRMMSQHPALSHEQAEHLTRHGVHQQPEGGFTWKFDPCFRLQWPFELPQPDMLILWQAITCPMLLLHGADSWTTSPQDDGRLAQVPAATFKMYENAGHWLHHDQLDRFLADLRTFL